MNNGPSFQLLLLYSWPFVYTYCFNFNKLFELNLNSDEQKIYAQLTHVFASWVKRVKPVAFIYFSFETVHEYYVHIEVYDFSQLMKLKTLLLPSMNHHCVEMKAWHKSQSDSSDPTQNATFIWQFLHGLDKVGAVNSWNGVQQTHFWLKYRHQLKKNSKLPMTMFLHGILLPV